MGGKIEISREQLERVRLMLELSYGAVPIVETLLRLLAAPVVERKPPIAYMRNEGTPDNLVKCTFTCPGAFGVYRGPQSLSAEQPAPVAVVLPERMPNDIFGEPFDQGWNACLDMVKELNQ